MQSLGISPTDSIIQVLLRHFSKITFLRKSLGMTGPDLASARVSCSSITVEHADVHVAIRKLWPAAVKGIASRLLSPLRIAAGAVTAFSTAPFDHSLSRHKAVEIDISSF